MIRKFIRTDARIKEIVDGNSAPLNHSEREIAGYRDALDEIHTSHEQMPFSENLILHIHEVMTGIAGYDLSGKYKEECPDCYRSYYCMGSIVKLGQARATKYVNAKYIKKN